MKSVLIFLATVLGIVAANADDSPVSLPTPTIVSISEVARIKAQEFSRVLGQLKLQEVAIQRGANVDVDALALNRAQQKAFEQELLKLDISLLELEMQRLSAVLRPNHPKAVALRGEIERLKASVPDGP